MAFAQGVHFQKGQKTLILVDFVDRRLAFYNLTKNTIRHILVG